MARQRNYAAEYASRDERARSDYGLTGYSQLRRLGGRTGLERTFPLSDRSRQLIEQRARETGVNTRQAVARAHSEYIKARIDVARRDTRLGIASPEQRRIAHSFREAVSELGQPLPPPSDRRAVTEMYDWYDEWWGEYDPWDELEDYDTNAEAS